MFRAANRSSSGAQLYLSGRGGNSVPTQPGKRPVTTWVYKPEAANTVWSSWWWAVCRTKHVEPSINFEIINSITRLHLVGYFYWFINYTLTPFLSLWNHVLDMWSEIFDSFLFFFCFESLWFYICSVAQIVRVCSCSLYVFGVKYFLLCNTDRHWNTVISKYANKWGCLYLTFWLNKWLVVSDSWIAFLKKCCFKTVNFIPLSFEFCKVETHLTVLTLRRLMSYIYIYIYIYIWSTHSWSF
jgi:hypothetical protein